MSSSVTSISQSSIDDTTTTTERTATPEPQDGPWEEWGWDSVHALPRILKMVEAWRKLRAIIAADLSSAIPEELKVVSVLEQPAEELVIVEWCVRETLEGPGGLPEPSSSRREITLPKSEGFIRAQQVVTLLQDLGYLGAPSMPRLQGVALPHPLNSDGWTCEYVRPLFDGEDARRRTWQQAEDLAADIIKQVDVVDNEWYHVARWLDRGKEGPIFNPEEIVDDIVDPRTDYPGHDLEMGESSTASSTKLADLGAGSGVSADPKAKGKDGAKSSPKATPEPMEFAAARVLEARNVLKVLQIVYWDRVVKALDKVDGCKKDRVFLRYRWKLAIERAAKRLQDETESGLIQASLPE